jgi:atypical dual specificity phosphatase
MTPITVYGEWLYAKHSIYYDKLPDLFIAYDIYIPEDDEWLAPDKFESEMSQTNINFIKPELKIFNNISDVVRESEKPSEYRNGIREGIVIKLSDERKVVSSFKIVNKYFDRREDFNQELIRNSLIKK